MHFPFQLRSITSSCPSGAFFRYSHFWLLYGFRIGSDRTFVYNLSVPRTSVSVQLHLYVLIQIQKGHIFVSDAYPFSAAFYFK